MTLSINGKPLDDYRQAYVVAECGANHAGGLLLAHRLVDAAADAHADAIKFQTIDMKNLAADVPIILGHDAQHDAWIRRLGITRLPELFAKSGLPRPWHKELKAHAEARGIAFLSTPFSVDAARFLVEEIGVAALKVASGDLTFTPLLEYAATTQIPIILSTGCAIIPEIQRAVDILDWQRTILLHCLARYPHAATVANLRSLNTLRNHFKLPVGYSDHTTDYCMIPTAATTIGCCVYEKHFTLSDGAYTPDTQHSLNEHQFAEMVRTIRETQMALGDGNRAELNDLERHEEKWTRRWDADWLRPTEAARHGAWE